MRNRHFLLGAATTLAVVALLASLLSFLILRTGVAPTNADATPSTLESKLFTTALRASISRNALSQKLVFGDATNEDLAQGAQIYESLCAQCHGHLNGRPAAFGSAFYPPAPDLRSTPSSYSDSELFWLIKHGVRNTGMPSWKRSLSDDDIKRVVALVRRIDSLPEDVQTKLEIGKGRDAGD